MATTLELLEAPWAFSQTGPLTTTGFIREAGRRGLRLDARTLQLLHDRGELSPLVMVTATQVGDPRAPIDEPAPGDSTLRELRLAQRQGRVLDPMQQSEDTIRFSGRRVDDPHQWWNGLLYSHWQLLHADWLRALAASSIESGSGLGGASPRGIAASRRQMAVVLTVLEPRYLPEIEFGWLHLRGVEAEEWRGWRRRFNPSVALEWLGLDSHQVVSQADELLWQAKRIDPTGRCSRLIRRAPRDSWRSLSGDALAAMDFRIAAEVLLRFSADLVRAKTSTTAAAGPDWHPRHERISARDEELDRTLSALGVSPHPGAILLIEGESERRLIPRVFEHLGFGTAPDLVQVVCMNGVHRDLSLLATASVAPLLGRRRTDHYELLRPPCRLFIAVDPEGRWRTEDHAENARRKIVKTLQSVVKAQADDVDTSVLDDLVEVRRWSARCFEYAHFNDDELLKAITTIHTSVDRPPDAVIRRLIADGRHHNRDIKLVWKDWAHKPAKPRLADALWPALRRRIDVAVESDDGLPEVAVVAIDAHATAQQFSRGTWSLDLESGSP